MRLELLYAVASRRIYHPMCGYDLSQPWQLAVAQLPPPIIAIFPQLNIYPITVVVKKLNSRKPALPTIYILITQLLLLFLPQRLLRRQSKPGYR